MTSRHGPRRKAPSPGPQGAADALRLVTEAHVRGMAEHLMTVLAPKGIEPHHVEGLPQGRWVLLDYVDFVVHVFHPELREFYQLERLWGDAPVVAPGDPRREG